jgi:trehalose 6-phosphate phosphatase
VEREDRREIAARLDRAEGAFLGIDFDGTMAPIADDPDRPTIALDVRSALERFVSRPDATVAVVSGRALSDLQGRVGLDGDEVVYAGNHGLELDREGNATAHPVGEGHRPAIRRAVEQLSDRLAGIPGWEIEDKGITATVHVRETPPHRVDEVRSVVEATVGEVDDGLRITTGKQVFEVRPDVEWDKGTAVEHLSADLPETWTTIYVGDDTTDEDAFRAVGPDGTAVLVGSREETAADYRLRGQDAVAPFLDWVADCLAGEHRLTEP